MQEEQPSSFLIIKEPPFPASYNRETYVARTLEEMHPSYSYAEYESQVRFVVRRLPDSPDELNNLITQFFPDADLDKTMIQSFEDTRGGKGARVSIFKAKAIEAEADSMHEAREVLQTQIPEGFLIKSERIVSNPERTSVIGRGTTEEEAVTKAQSQVPSGALIASTRTINQPDHKTLTIAAFDAEEARAKADEKANTDAGTIVKSLKMASPGKKGFLGMGRKPNIYECDIFKQAAVEVVYTRGKARLVGILAEATKKEDSNEELNSQLIEARDLDEVKMLLAKGADVNAKDSEGKTPLMNAAYYGRKEIVKFLLEHGADVNARYVDGCTALIWAAGEGEAETLEILLQHGADIHATERHNNTALMIANRMKRTTTARMLADWEKGRSAAADEPRAPESARSPKASSPGLRSICLREDYLGMSQEERSQFASHFHSMLESRFPDTDFGYESFPELRYDEMVFSTLFSDLLQSGQILSAGRERFRLAPKIVRTSRKKLARPDYPSYMLPTIPPQGRSFEVDEDCIMVPIGDCNCPVCHENLGDIVPSHGANVVVRFHRAHGVHFWWSIVPHCGKKLLVSNSGM